MHSDNDRSLVPIACRFVPYDQWFITHLDDNWKVKQVKHWVLSKCNLVQSPDARTQRSVSPITFASSIRSRHSVNSSDEGYNEDDEYDDDSEDDLPPRCGVSRSHNIYSLSRNRQSSQTVQPGSSPLVDQYTLISFSTGTMLEDDFTLSWYNLRPYELLEMHPAGTIISLPREILADYIQPYFQAKVRALRAVWSHKSGRFEAPGHDSQHELGGSRGQDKFGPLLDAFSPKQTSLQSDKRRKAKVEWKDRWVVINHGILSLCKEHATGLPVHQFSLATMRALRGADTLERTFSITAEPRVVCIKFRTIHSGPVPGVVSPPPSAPSSPISEHWKSNLNQDSRDASLPHVEGIATQTKHGIERERSRKRSGKYQHDPNDVYKGEGEWLVLDMLDDHAFSSILRILHRHSPHPISSSFLPSSSTITVANNSGFTPAISSSAYSSSYDTIPYPEWRVNTAENARKAGMGDVGKPMAWVLWTEKGLGESLMGNIRQHRHAFSQEMRYKTSPITSHVYLDPEDESDDDSEMEWEGWMRDLERQGRIKKQQSEKATGHSTPRQPHIDTSVSSPLPSPPLSDASSSGSPRLRSPSLSLSHSPSSSLSTHPPHYPNISNIIQATRATSPRGFISADLPRSPERLRTTTVSVVSVGSAPSSSRRRSSTVSSETTSKRSQDKGRRDGDSPPVVLANGNRVSPRVIRASSSLRGAPSSSLRHAHSSSNLKASYPPYASDAADSTGHPGPSSPPKRQNTFIRGMSLRAGKFVKGLDSAIDFMDETA